MMLSPSEKNTLSRLIHDINNPLSVIYSSLYMIQLQHPEISDYKYWKETLSDLEELKVLLQQQYQSTVDVNVNT